MYPMSATAPRIHSANEGVNASQARDAFTKGVIVGSIAKSRVKDSGSSFQVEELTADASTDRQSVIPSDHGE